MKKITSIQDLFPDYLNTDALLHALDPESYSLHENDELVILHFTKPKGSLVFSVGELTEMNKPSFITFYQMDRTRLTKEDVLAAVKEQFGKEIRR